MTQREQRRPERDRVTFAGRVVGLGGIVLSALIYFAQVLIRGHGEVSLELLGTFLTLWGATEGVGALRQLKGGEE